jgi:hypothetical protein
MSRDGGSHLPLCPSRSSPARRLLQELLRRLSSPARPAAGLRFSGLLAGSFTGLTWNGVGLSAARKRLLRTARIDGNRDGNVDHPERQRPGKWIEGLPRLRSVSQAQQEIAEFHEASKDACLWAVIAGSGDAGQAEDMVAEAFARAWASWAKVRRYSAPRGWVVRSALNTGVSWWRPAAAKSRWPAMMLPRSPIRPGALTPL